MEKNKLRRRMIALRKSFSGKNRADDQIVRRITRLSQWKKARVVCMYTSLPNEVDTKKLFMNKIVVDPENLTGERVDLYIVPGLAFDRNGNRLGRGRGFYDKLLSGITVPKIGLAYEIQVLAEVPHTSYDVPMDVVVTEEGVYENKAS